MEKLNFDNGTRTFEVNGSTVITFNPSDIGFANEVFKLTEQFEAIRAENEKIAEGDDVYEAVRRSDAEMRAAVDSVFGEGVSAGLFGKANVFSPCDGLPMVLNFLLAVLDVIDENIDKAVKPNPRINAYVEKYNKKYGKYLG